MKKAVNLSFTLKQILIGLAILASSNAAYSSGGLTKYPSPCIETLEPLPYHPAFMYMAYFEYNLEIPEGLGIPGVDLPEMYIYAYMPNNFSQQVAISNSIPFKPAKNGFHESSLTTFNLQELSHFLYLCQQNPFADVIVGEYKVTVVGLDNGTPVPYFNLHPELFPNLQIEDLIMDSFHNFTCNTPPGNYDAEITNIDKQSQIKKTYSDSDSNEFGLNQIKSNYKIFPNPFNDYIDIQLEEYNSETDVRIKVFDSTGRIHYDTFSDQGSFKLNLHFLKPGLYQLIIFSENEKFIHSIIKT